MSMQAVVNLARLDLNDDDKVRYPDSKLLPFVNNFIQEAVKNRPDLFLGSFLSLPDDNLKLVDTFPLPNKYKRACADFVIARSNLLNTEDGKIPLASAYMGMSAKQGGVA